MLLRPFSRDGKRIHLINIDRQLFVRDASLRDQCYGRKIYGDTPEFEDSLALVENEVARVLRVARTEDSLPDRLSEDYQSLLFFIGLQILRTPLAGRSLNETLDKMIKQTYADDPRFSDSDFEEYRIGYERPELAQLGLIPHLLPSLSDLAMLLLAIDERRGHLPPFIISDHPALKHNMYTEGLAGIGTLGLLSRGLLVYMPIGPRHALVLFDNSVYYSGFLQKRLVKLKSKSDIRRLNLLQTIGADRNIYFSGADRRDEVSALVARALPHRQSSRSEVAEFISEDDPNWSIVAAHEPLLDIRLRLQFLKIRRRSLKVPLANRSSNRREMPNLMDLPEPPDAPRGHYWRRDKDNK
jgi:hypothetical protein